MGVPLWACCLVSRVCWVGCLFWCYLCLCLCAFSIWVWLVVLVALRFGCCDCVLLRFGVWCLSRLVDGCDFAAGL